VFSWLVVIKTLYFVWTNFGKHNASISVLIHLSFIYFLIKINKKSLSYLKTCRLKCVYVHVSISSLIFSFWIKLFS